MIRGMNWGCLSFLILFPAGILIWARGEMRRRMAMPPEELAKLEADEDYGPIDEKLECIFCHSKNCVRTQSNTRSLKETFSNDNLIKAHSWRSEPLVALFAPKEYDDPLQIKEISKAHCMKCGNDWEFYPPEEKTNK
jgi:hypothetical protein